MISRRTVYFFVAALLLSLPLIKEVVAKKPLCVQDTRLRLTQPHLAAVDRQSPARLVRVLQEDEPDQDPVSPCPSTGYGAILKVLGFADGCLWVCALASLFSDVRKQQQWKRRHRRRTSATGRGRG